MSDNTIVLDAHVNTMVSRHMDSLNRQILVDDREYESSFFTPGSPVNIPQTKTVSYAQFSYNMMYTNAEAIARDFPTLAEHANTVNYHQHDRDGVIASFDFMLAPEVAEVLKMQSRILKQQYSEQLKEQARLTGYWEKTALGRKMRIDDLCGHWLVGRLIKWLCI